MHYFSSLLYVVNLTPVVNFGEVRRAQLEKIHSPHLYDGAPGIFSHLLRYVQMLKREWGAESNGKLPHLFIPVKTATLVQVFTVKDLPFDRTFDDNAVEDLPLSRTATLVQVFTVQDLPFDRTSDDDDDNYIYIYIIINIIIIIIIIIIIEV